jgi:ribosome-associated translation inhibitor RaiA
MNTHIKATAIVMNPTISSHIDKYVKKIEHIIGDDESVKCDIEVGRTTAHHHKGDIFQAELHIVGNKHNIYTKAEKSDLLNAIDEACDEAIYSLTSRRKKYIAIARRGGAKVKALAKGLWPWGKDSDDTQNV